MALRMAKKELRNSVKQRLKNVSAESSKTQSSKALEVLFGMPQYQNARRISVYLSMASGEINTSDIVHDAFKKGKRVFVPYTYATSKSEGGLPSSVMDMLHLRDIEDYEGLQLDRWGIPTPSDSSISSRENSFGTQGQSRGSEDALNGQNGGLDLIVMPGMAFDTSMNRLGHGKGYYDYFLERTMRHADKNKKEMPWLVGLALKEQLSEDESVPTDSTDWKLDALIVGDGQVFSRSES